MSDKQARKNTARRILKKRLTRVAGSALILAILGTLLFFAWQRSSQPVNIDYEGRIVDRWGDYSESQQGSRPRLRLVVETDDGRRLTVNVNPNIYESAKVGMRIRSKSGEVVLIDAKQNQPVGK